MEIFPRSISITGVCCCSGQILLQISDVFLVCVFEFSHFEIQFKLNHGTQSQSCFEKDFNPEIHFPTGDHTEEDADAIHDYIIHGAHLKWDEDNASDAWASVRDFFYDIAARIMALTL